MVGRVSPAAAFALLVTDEIIHYVVTFFNVYLVVKDKPQT